MTDIISNDLIYKRGVKGEVRVWSMQYQGDKHRVISGILGGKMTETGWTTCKPKNVGRANATTPEQQAAAEVTAKYTKQLKSNYFYDKFEIDNLQYLEPMLATNWDVRKKSVDVQKGVFTQPKLDGIRCIGSAKGADTREGEAIVSIPHIVDSMQEVLSAYPGLVLDGELYNHALKEDFNKIASLVRKEKHTPKTLAETARLVQYHVYDVPSHPGTFSERQDFLMMIFDKYLCKFPDSFRRVETLFVSDEETLDRLYGKWMTEGYEGQIIRLDEVYQAQRRSNYLMKRKEFDTAEFPVTGMEEGNGNWAGCCKRFLISLEDGTPGEATPRGTQEAMRELLLSGKAPDWATVRFFGRTPDGALRFPVAVDYGYGKRVD